MNIKSHLIFFVTDQVRSTAFYRHVFNTDPTLNVPGMTEFELNQGTKLGLMPEAGIKRILGDKITDPALANGAPRAELYLIVERPQDYLDRALEKGARLLGPIEMRNWGEAVGYCSDPDGHILAFAQD